MNEFLGAAFGFPTVIFTALLGVVLVYWLLAMIGMVDIEASGLDVDVEIADGDPGELGTLASYVVAMGLNGVPFSVVISLVVFVGWTLSTLAGLWLMPWVPTAALRITVGLGVLVGVLALSIVITARLVRPLRKLFVTHGARSNASLVGQRCKVLTGTVDGQVGRAEVQQRGASINVRVWAATPNTFSRGSSAQIAEYDEATGRYRIEPG